MTALYSYGNNLIPSRDFGMLWVVSTYFYSLIHCDMAAEQSWCKSSHSVTCNFKTTHIARRVKSKFFHESSRTLWDLASVLTHQSSLSLFSSLHPCMHPSVSIFFRVIYVNNWPKLRECTDKKAILTLVSWNIESNKDFIYSLNIVTDIPLYAR